MSKQTTDLVNESKQLDLTKDGLIVRRVDSSFSTTLDVSDVTDEVIPAGRVLVRTLATGVIHPQPIGSTNAYEAIDLGTPAEGQTPAVAATEEYAGVLGSSILTSNPFADVVERGEVNAAACDVAPLAEAVTLLPHILFTQDY